MRTAMRDRPSTVSVRWRPVTSHRPSLRRIYLFPPADADRNDFRDAVLFHRDAEERRGCGDGFLVVRDHDELTRFAELHEHVRETADVALVERRVDLVE